VAAACGHDEQTMVYRQATTTTSTAPPTTVAPTTTMQRLPLPPPHGPSVLITRTGVVVAIRAREGTGWSVTTPCERRAHVKGGVVLRRATVVLDPGHGGAETGATGDNGLRESDLNLAVARLVKTGLERQGAAVVLTRTADYRASLGARAGVARALRPAVFVSIHHNGGVDGRATKPGTETYYQFRSSSSKRLAGLLYEEVLATFQRYPGIEWWGNVDAGAKWRLNDGGGDYYGILRMTAGVNAALSEGLFLSASRPEADLLARPDVQQAEADAIVRAIRRDLLSEDAGSGYVTPIKRTTPAGSGGGVSNCVDPKLE
jgi:N-acetylmuramoyl-L-alanine amidase